MFYKHGNSTININIYKFSVKMATNSHSVCQGEEVTDILGLNKTQIHSVNVSAEYEERNHKI